MKFKNATKDLDRKNNERLYIKSKSPFAPKQYKDLYPKGFKIFTFNSGFKKKNYSIYNTREKGVKAALKLIKKNDIVAILGKGREEYQDVRGEKIYYSDLEAIRSYSCESI